MDVQQSQRDVYQPAGSGDRFECRHDFDQFHHGQREPLLSVDDDGPVDRVRTWIPFNLLRRPVTTLGLRVSLFDDGSRGQQPVGVRGDLHWFHDFPSPHLPDAAPSQATTGDVRMPAILIFRGLGRDLGAGK